MSHRCCPECNRSPRSGFAFAEGSIRAVALRETGLERCLALAALASPLKTVAFGTDSTCRSASSNLRNAGDVPGSDFMSI